MSKNIEIKLVGQPIFKQIINLADSVNLNNLIIKHKADQVTQKQNQKRIQSIASGVIFMFFEKPHKTGVHDKIFLKELELVSHSMVVFDRAYNYYKRAG